MLSPHAEGNQRFCRFCCREGRRKRKITAAAEAILRDVVLFGCSFEDVSHLLMR